MVDEKSLRELNAVIKTLLYFKARKMNCTLMEIYRFLIKFDRRADSSIGIEKVYKYLSWL
ncbi:MAG: hypothetical protein GF347_00340, partial [Candidatus Moranbacteria bacterium]|nr:hypothetical protein [Candidatus Moranbacteria bacterium]